MDTKNEFTVNDRHLAIFLKNHGANLIRIENGKFVFANDDTLDEKLALFEEAQKRCMF